MIQNKERKFLEEIMDASDEDTISKEFIRKLSEEHGIKPFQAENVWSFYRQDKSKMKVCRGLPCKLKTGNSESRHLEKYPDEKIETVSCLGLCEHAPVAWSNGKYYHLAGGDTVEIGTDPHSYAMEVVTDIEDYLERDGFKTLLNVFRERTSSELVELVKELNLKGFGGSGFPAYVKWKAVSGAGSEEKFLLVNAHEGEPGTFKDRILMETNPFSLIEASFIAALSVGATQIIIALKHEYVNAEKTLNNALDESRKYIAGKGGKIALPAIDIIRVPGYYITGEESALMEAIEGRRSEPRLRPPYPAEVGLYGKPTLIDNVETLIYFLERLKDYEATGRVTTGKKSYCLTGDVKHPGHYRLNYGSPSSALVTDLGGTGLFELKAILPGGLSGGIIPAEKGAVNLDFDSVKKAGAGMGTGAMIAVSKDRCMVDIMANVEKFFEVESCGKCMPCRYGTAELSKLFRNLKKGMATLEDLKSARKTADVMLKGSICGLGQASAKMFMDSLVYFNQEIEEHVSGTCKENICFRGGE